MAPLSLLSLLLLLISPYLASSSTVDPNDLIIQQVTSSSSDGHDEALTSSEEHHHFSLFKSKYNKAYSTQEEHDYRLSVFKANLRRAKRHQLSDPSAVHGVTKFSDLTPAEFRKSYLGLNNKKKGGLLLKQNKGSLGLPSDAHKAPILPTNDLPEDFDWREKGAVTGVKDQGSCGSCWSFSTTGALEGAHFIATGELVSLSEQQLVDCDHECDPEERNSCDSGCNGGLMNNAFEYTLKAGGLERESDYPYTGKNGQCKFDKSKIVASVSNFSVISSDEDQMAANLVKHGPLAVGINAAWMQTYIGGVSCPYICSKNLLDHGVLIVGYGSSAYSTIRFKNKPYWIIKNSWGKNWGEDGYYYLCKGPHSHNECGVNQMVSMVAAPEVSE